MKGNKPTLAEKYEVLCQFAKTILTDGCAPEKKARAEQLMFSFGGKVMGILLATGDTPLPQECEDSYERLFSIDPESFKLIAEIITRRQLYKYAIELQKLVKILERE